MSEGDTPPTHTHCTSDSHAHSASHRHPYNVWLCNSATQYEWHSYTHTHTPLAHLGMQELVLSLLQSSTPQNLLTSLPKSHPVSYQCCMSFCSPMFRLLFFLNGRLVSLLAAERIEYMPLNPSLHLSAKVLKELCLPVVFFYLFPNRLLQSRLLISPGLCYPEKVKGYNKYLSPEVEKKL